MHETVSKLSWFLQFLEGMTIDKPDKIGLFN
jgi:hypothetical protein